jgi:hypothetical protein
VMFALKALPNQSGMWFEGSSRVKLSDFGLTPPRGVFGVRLVIGTKDEMSVLFRYWRAKVARCKLSSMTEFRAHQFRGRHARSGNAA